MIKERIISAIIGTLLILAFQPFGLHAFGLMRWLLMLGLAVCVFTSCLLSEYIIRYIFRMPYNKEDNMNYTIKRNICYQIVNMVLMTALISVLLDTFASNDVVDNHFSLNNLLVVFAMVFGTHVIIGLYWKNVYWKRHYMHQLADAQRLNGILQERQRAKSPQPTSQSVTPGAAAAQSSEKPADSSPSGDASGEAKTSDSESDTILLTGTTKESVTIRLSEFLYAESDGNYVSVYYLSEGMRKKSVLRASIKNIAQMLCRTRGIVQCHRAFIVNIAYVHHVEGRSSGIGLKLRGVTDVIPVSKSYVSEVKLLIQNPD